MNTYTRIIKKSFAFVGLFAFMFAQIAPVVAYAVVSEMTPQSYTTYDTPIVKDTYVDQDSIGGKNNINYGAANSIEVKSHNGKNRRMFIQANTPSVPMGAVIDSVRLYVYMYNRPSTSIRLYSVSQIIDAWDENTVTWNNQPSASTTPIAIHSIFPVDNSWIMFEVTADVKAVLAGQSVNNGWVIKDKFENSGTSYLAEFRSREYSGICSDSPSPLCEPYLEVTYHYEGGITGNVWNDLNADGVRNEGELPKEGEVVWIYNATTNITATSTSDGTYSVSGLVPGEYKVCRSTLNTSTQSFPNLGVLCPGNTRGEYVQVSSSVESGPDYGVFQGGSVKVILNINPALTEDLFNFDLAYNNATTSYTLYSGQTEYVFTGLVPGEGYSISQAMPSWWAEQFGVCVSGETEVSPNLFAVNAGNQVVCTFSNVKKASLTVTNYVDPMQGTYTFTLASLGSESVFEPVVLGNNESFGFMSLIPGTYTLTETIEEGLDEETASCVVGDAVIDPRTGPFEIPAGARIQCTYNHSQLGVVSGTVFEDMNADTVRDDTDASLSGWVVKLYKITEELIVPEGQETPLPVEISTEIASKVTDETGYIFGQLSPGIYKVCEELNTPFIQSLPLSDEGCGSSRGYRFSVSFGDIVNKYFGNFELAKLSGVVFSDTNNNGSRDEGEVGIPGVTVHLGSTKVTDANGVYEFDDLMPGHYTVTLLNIPAHSSYSTPTLGKHMIQAFSGESYVGDFGIFTDTDTPSLPVHQTPLDGAVVRPLGLILDWSDAVDPSLSSVTYQYQSALSNATTTGNALSTPIYSATLSTSQIDASGTSEGTYFWQVKACDTAHNCTEWTNPWSLVVDMTAPVSSFTSPNPDSNIEDEFITIAGSTTDLHNVASTTLEFAPYTASVGETPASCGAYTTITSLVQGVASTTFNWSYNWTPAEDGVYCLTAHGQDEAGNTEASPFITNITFKKKVVTTTGGGGGTSTGGGSSGGNGPIVGSFGGGSSSNGGSTTALGTGGSPDGAVLPTSTSPEEQPTQSSVGSNTYAPLAFSGNTYTGEYADGSGLSDSASASTTYSNTNTPDEEEGYNSNLGAVGVLGEWNNWYWLWILIVLLIIAGVYYSTRERNK